jgi:hypothetical protein
MKPTSSFTRRDFLKLSASGALGLFLAETGLDRALALSEPPASHGRVLMSGLFMYAIPSFGGESWKSFGKDQVVPISEVVEGEAGNPYNTAWYRIGDEGYHLLRLGAARRNALQQAQSSDIRAEGQVGEITVPFSLARPEPNMPLKGRRLYYQTTHWVKRTVVNRAQKSIWYEIYDFHERKFYYVPTHDMRILPDDELAPLSPDVPEAQKHIHIDLATQTVTAFEGDNPVLISRCSSGAGEHQNPAG